MISILHSVTLLFDQLLISTLFDDDGMLVVVVQVEETERLWNACVLYSVKNLSSGTAVGGEKLEGVATGFTLSQLLRVTKLRQGPLSLLNFIF